MVVAVLQAACRQHSSGRPLCTPPLYTSEATLSRMCQKCPTIAMLLASASHGPRNGCRPRGRRLQLCMLRPPSSPASCSMASWAPRRGESHSSRNVAHSFSWRSADASQRWRLRRRTLPTLPASPRCRDAAPGIPMPVPAPARAAADARCLALRSRRSRLCRGPGGRGPRCTSSLSRKAGCRWPQRSAGQRRVAALGLRLRRLCEVSSRF